MILIKKFLLIHGIFAQMKDHMMLQIQKLFLNLEMEHYRILILQ
jgi:hypothetical protein